jgi:uncharacterized protein (DUF302 family)
VEREPYLILVACNPPLAQGTLEAEPGLGVLPPCDVVVYQEQCETRVAAVDAEQMLSIVRNDELASTAARSAVGSRPWSDASGQLAGADRSRPRARRRRCGY